MICAIELLAMAHQWRKHFAPMIRMRLRINPWRNWRAIGFIPTAHQWRITAQAAPSFTIRQETDHEQHHHHRDRRTDLH